MSAKLIHWRDLFLADMIPSCKSSSSWYTLHVVTVSLLNNFSLLYVLIKPYYSTLQCLFTYDRTSTLWLTHSEIVSSSLAYWLSHTYCPSPLDTHSQRSLHPLPHCPAPGPSIRGHWLLRILTRVKLKCSQAHLAGLARAQRSYNTQFWHSLKRKATIIVGHVPEIMSLICAASELDTKYYYVWPVPSVNQSTRKVILSPHYHCC